MKHCDVAFSLSHHYACYSATKTSQHASQQINKYTEYISAILSEHNGH